MHEVWALELSPSQLFFKQQQQGPTHSVVGREGHRPTFKNPSAISKDDDDKEALYSFRSVNRVEHVLYLSRKSVQKKINPD